MTLLDKFNVPIMQRLYQGCDLSMLSRDTPSLALQYLLHPFKKHAFGFGNYSDISDSDVFWRTNTKSLSGNTLARIVDG